MKFSIKYFYLFIFSLIFTFSSIKAKVISYKSEYEISNVNNDKPRIPKKTYIDKATGYLTIDWLDSCQNSWVSNQRMMTRFVNSYGVGTVSEINYSLNESMDGKAMDFVLEIKENAEVVDRFYGKAKKENKLNISFVDREMSLDFPQDVIFPHQFLEEVVSNLYSGKKILVRKVYEGTIPEKFFRISVFFTDNVETSKNTSLPKEINKEFKKIRMAYYQDNDQTPIFEQTVLLNNQGIASEFRYDYPEYSLLLKLKKIEVVPSSCKK